MKQIFAGVLCILPALPVLAESAPQSDNDNTTLTPQVVNGRGQLIGEASSASEGYVSQQEIALRPLLRTGEVLEMVPGMVVTQHSGTGKANQYFLRGFNLDHGTDFATFVDGMPVNMRTHGHGQGYTDLNFVIPETLGSISYQKGSYYADVGDFSGAGSASLNTASHLDHGLLQLTAGQDNYYRALAMDSVEAAGGEWLYAVERNTYDGPWRDIDEDLDKTSLLLKHSRQLAGGDWSVTFMGYDNSWNSADQIPERAVKSGLIDELGSLDDSVGGESSRYSLSTSWRRDGVQVSAYAIRYDMNLWSNFTYYLDDTSNGDQFEQVDERWIYGGQASYVWHSEAGGLAMTNRVGADVRYDDIGEVGLYHTRDRDRLGTIRSDEVGELSTGLFAENTLYWTDRLRTVLGVRYDYYDFDVDTRTDTNVNGVDLTPNSGTESDDNIALKGSLIYALNSEWETYVSAGQGLHSNDARGTTIQVDPGDGSAVDQVDPLVDSMGYEIGLRGFWNERLNTSLALWQLDLDSELLFVGDAGNTEASRASRRQGAELTAYYRITDQLTLDLEYAWTDAEFKDYSADGDDIPGAIENVAQAGLSAQLGNGWYGSVRVRYFGERPLIEDGSVKSDPTTVVNVKAAYETQKWVFSADVLNLLDSDDHDIDYYYESQLASESSPAEDVHYHVMEPRTLRFSAGYKF
ncbi:MAG: TonB-dependent receptor [Oceanospirillaceae bacterium]|nr:TonB-dependent receptor [Oceanospirillaceae bacterium]MBT12745.1 TonB-dependent receptor [Oceanospirillaceae bacterium]|tara:strand:+ start:134327 stop:136399 length:2073 start_codon:yes stop_codon:yes gene_type:complete